jgi:hypothetical protein
VLAESLSGRGGLEPYLALRLSRSSHLSYPPWTMSNTRAKKEREKRHVEVFRDLYAHFPQGEIISHEAQERPDAIIISPLGRIGIEITCVHEESQKKDESEIEAVISQAVRIYERENLPKLHVGVHIGSGKTLSRQKRPAIAAAIARLIKANVPVEGGLADLENDWNDPDAFPYEINSILILRHSALTQNYWNCASVGFIQENFPDTLQKIISDKGASLLGYDSSCVEQWLLVVGKNESASTAYDPSPATLAHVYESVFKKVFFLNLFSRKLHDLNLHRLS